MTTAAGGAAGAGGLYAPLRQLLSDSESEDECRKRTDHDLHGSESCANLDINSGLHSGRQNHLSLSDLDDPTHPHTADTTLDNISFLHSDATPKLSLARRLSFVASILLCLLTVVVFLWVVPCAELSSCAAGEWRDRTTSWELPYDDVELSGTVQIVDGAQANSKNLIFIYRGNHMRQQSGKGVDNGVLLIVGNSGKIGWYTREPRIPTQVDCHMLDVNSDGRKDCLVSGSEGLLTAVDPLSGTNYWNLQRQSGNIKIISIDFPVLIKDVDGDRVSDLLTSATIWPNTDHNSLLVVSGTNGHVIGQPLLIGDCVNVHNIVVNSSYNISYSCRNSTTEALRMMSYQQLHKRVVKADHTPTRNTPIRKDHLNLSLKKKIGNTINFFKNGKGKLMVENSGECPDHCRVNLKLILQKNGSSSVAWEYGANHVFAMKPSSFAFANSIHGFVLKL